MNSHIEQQKVELSTPIEQTNLFGTDGIRAQVGTFPCTQQDLAQLGYAIGSWAIEKFGTGACILIGHDTRESAHFMIQSLSEGLFQHPIALCNAGVLPTPGVIKIAQSDPSIDAALIITASHNPYQDNGIKIIDKKNGKLSLQDEQRISQLFYQQRIRPCPPRAKLYRYARAQESYVALVKSYFRSDTLAGMKIVVDCAHGATSAIAEPLFTQLGATVVVLNNKPDGRNINHACGALHIEELQRVVMQEKADLGFAFDGDGDRIIVVNKDGMVKDGDDILALLIDHPAYTSSPALVCTVMSNGGLEIFARSKNKAIIRTTVGDKYVSAKLQENKLLLGGEQSGHILLADFLLSSDGLFAALRISEVVKITGNWELRTFDHIAQVLINVPVINKRDLQEPDLAAIIKEKENQLENKGIVLVRYSGTENILRIMVQHSDRSLAERIGSELAKKLKETI